MSTNSRGLLVAAVMSLTGLLLVAPAPAQLGTASENKGSAGNKLEPPSPTFKAEEGGEYIPYLWGALIVMLAIGVNLIPTKRGHQD
ncbi:MAG: hypothetical protein ACT4PL_09550 [Phycisphaerales bacterium]